MRLTNILLFLLILTLGFPVNSYAIDSGKENAVMSLSAKTNKFENELFLIRMLPRTPNQIAAFYEARGFPIIAINEVRQLCFITVGFANKSNEKLYHDLVEWQFIDKDGAIKRIVRSDWKQRWIKLGLKARFQSTFRWTLLPEKRDFYAQETAGGNITLPRTGRPVTITARVKIGNPKSKIYEITFKNVECAKDPA